MLIKYHNAISATVIAIGLSISILTLAQTDTQTPLEPTQEELQTKGITFPVAKLGNCATKDECKTYCNDPANMSSCIAFAEKNGLMNKNEAARAKKFQTTIQRGEGPGGCSGPEECDQFCRNIANIETCVAFAEKNGIKDSHVDEGRKMLSYLKAGGQMPGGCTDKTSCEAYCGNFSHAEECFVFAKKIGIFQKGRAQYEQRKDFGAEPSLEQMERFTTFMKNGETPGSCKSKNECETYCQNQSHFEECIDFGKKAGYIKPEQAEKMKQFKGKGPGGCDSAESCHAYCNNPTNQEACFAFAKESGFIEEDHIQEAKDGFVRLRQGLESAPQEVTACLKTSMGTSIIEDIQTGKLVPGQEIGERVRECFEKFGKKSNPSEVFKNAPPKAISCMKEKLGDSFNDIRQGKVAHTPEFADAIRACFQQIRLEEHFTQRGEGEGTRGGPMGPPPADILRSAPPEVQSCIKEKLGMENIIDPNAAIEQNPEKFASIRECFQNFRPEGIHEGFPGREGMPQGMPPREGSYNSQDGRGVPSQVLACLKLKVPEEVYMRIARGEQIQESGIQQLIANCHTETSPMKNCSALPTQEEREKCMATQGMMPSAPQPMSYPQSPTGEIHQAPPTYTCGTPEECEKLRMIQQQYPTEPMPMPAPTPEPAPTTSSSPTTRVTPIEQIASGLYTIYRAALDLIR